MTTTNTPNGAIAIPLFGFGKNGCEGPQCITFDMDFTAGTEVDVDFSAIQSQAKFSGVETVYFDNSANGSQISWVCDGTYQTGKIPANSCAYVNLLVSNPPKITFTSAGGVRVRTSFLNYFVPPIIWKP